MAANVQRVTLAMKLEGFAGIKNIGKDFKNLNKTLKLTAPQLDKLVKSITKVHGNTKLSKAAFEKQISALTKLKNNVGIGTVAYKKLSTELDKVRAKMNAVTAAAAPQGGMFARLNARFQKIPVGGRAALGALAGTATAGFGSTGQLAFAGGAVGGAPGAFIGAGLGAAMDTISYAADAATYASEMQKLRIALKGVTKDQATYEKGLKIITDTSRKLNVPIAASTKQFTTLSASVLGAGGTIEQAEEVFTGVSNAIKATGGNAEDVQSAIRAMSQIFGKGKVSAEELQGQLGERLAGAVVKFAEANGSSLQDLQKDLRDGVVGLDQVIKFAEKLNIDFAETAEEIANSSADAGQKLKQRMEDLKLAIGEGVQPIGGAFQKSFADIADAIVKTEPLIKGINLVLQTLGATVFTVVEGFRFLARTMIDNFKLMDAIRRLDFKEAKRVVNDFFKDTREQAKLNAKAFAEMFDYDPFGLTDKDDNTDGKPLSKSNLAGLGDDKNSPLASFAKSAFDVTKQVENAFVNAFKGMEDALVKFVMTGKLNFSDLARSIIADLTRMLVRAAIVKPLFSFLFPGLADGGVVSKGGLADPTFGTGVPSNPSSVFGSVNAKGNVFAKNKIVPYKMGGIISKPTIFPMRNGAGLMGEAGPEGILPLKRGKDGKLGVIANGGGVGNIVVNVDASGTSVEGGEQESRELGRLIAVAVQSEILEQQRPGGLLA